MNPTFRAVHKIRQTLVHPSRHGIRLVAVAIAIITGLGGSFLEANTHFKELEIGNIVEQLQATLERREEIKDIQNI